MLVLLLIVLLICIGIVSYFYLVTVKGYQYFSQRNIPTPPFRFFFGHLKTLWNVPSFHRQLETWTKQYGKIYGIYQGRLPTFVVSDPDFLHEVFVKQFVAFHGRNNTFVNKKFLNVFAASGAEWRRHRHVINPTFSAAKLKLMSPLINGCIHDVMDKLSEHAIDGNEFNIYVYYKRMTMDVICKHIDVEFLVCVPFCLGRCAFGIDTDLQNNPDNLYFKKVEELFAHDMESDRSFRLAQLLPELAPIIGIVPFSSIIGRVLINTYILPLISNKQLEESALIWLFKRIHPIIEQREQTPTSRMDLLQLMLQVMTEETQDGSKTNYRLTREEVMSNVLFFMAAGYETTSTALANATYELVRHPEVLQKLQTEIDQLPLNNNSESAEQTKEYPDYDIVTKMPYMDMFVSEVLRMHPIANRVIQRRVSQDTTIQGIQINKGKKIFLKDFPITLHFGLFKIRLCMLIFILYILIVNCGVQKIHTCSIPNDMKQNVIQWLIYHLVLGHDCALACVLQ